MRFSMLHTFAYIQLILGVLSMIGAAVIVIAMLFLPNSQDPGVRWLTSTYGMAMVVGLFLFGLQLGAMGQFFLVVMQIEENTRA